MVYKQEIITGLGEVSLDEGLLKSFMDKVKAGEYPQLSIANDTDDLKELEDIAKDYRARFESVLVLGTGGSSLGAQTLCALRYAGLGLPQPKPHLYFMDNIDPDTFEDLFKAIDLKTTGVLAVSKSGSTAETLSQLLVIMDKFKDAVGEGALKDHITVITEPKDSPLARIAKGNSLRTLEHHTQIGGRFSVFSNVGMLPALIAGLDVRMIRDGAKRVLANPELPLKGAQAIYQLYDEKKITNTVLMPYLDRLFLFAGWFRQLWAESLGKDGKGLTPIRALGTVDQHSQTQLYLDGPKDKFFTFILSSCKGRGETFQSKDPDLAYLNGKTMGDLLDAEQRATVESLFEKKHPIRVLLVDVLTEESLGALLMHFMIETIVTADLLKVDAFDQPAVERGKVLTREYLKAG